MSDNPVSDRVEVGEYVCEKKRGGWIVGWHGASQVMAIPFEVALIEALLAARADKRNNFACVLAYNDGRVEECARIRAALLALPRWECLDESDDPLRERKDGELINREDAIEACGPAPGKDEVATREQALALGQT